MPNTGKFLTNDQHLLPLLKWYLQHVDERLESVATLDDRHYEYIKNPDGTVSGIRPDVICKGQAGGQNITEGYWRAFAQSLARDQEMPEKIRVVSFINHSNVHWTCSVAEFSLDPIFYKKMQDALRQRYSEIEIAGLRTIDLQNFINEQFKSEGSDIDIIHSQKIRGATEAVIRHYDSHNPDNPRGRYYLDYEETLNVFMAENIDEGPNIRIESKDCKRQVGNTCGDSTLYNGYTAGVLGLDPGLKENQVESAALRAFAEDHVPQLKPNRKDKPQAQSVVQFVAKVTKKAKELQPIQVLVVEDTLGGNVLSPVVSTEPPQKMHMPATVISTSPPSKKKDVSSADRMSNKSQLTHSTDWVKADPVHYQYDETSSTSKKTRKRALSESSLTRLSAHVQSMDGAPPSTPIDKSFVSAYMQKLKTVYPEKKWDCTDLGKNRCEFSEKKENGTSFTLEHITDGVKLEGETRAMDEMLKAIKELDALTSDEDELVFDVIVESKEEAIDACRKLFASGIKETQIETLQIAGKALNASDTKSLLLQVDDTTQHKKHKY